jgi:adenosylcobinamide-GDP ribazoletransferase
LTVQTVRGAIGLLTRFPVATSATDRPGARAFGLVGAAVGAVGAVPLVVLGSLAGEPWLGAIVALAMTAVVTGAMHLDGLADTADALLARDAEAADRARKDPRLGVGGVSALIFVIGVQAAALASVIGSAGALTAGLALLVASAIARVVPVVAVRAMPARVGGSAMGGWFGAHVSLGDSLVAAASAAALVTAAAIALGVGGTGLAVAAILELAAGVAITATITMARGGVDGDGIGAAIELSAAVGLAATAVLVG